MPWCLAGESFGLNGGGRRFTVLECGSFGKGRRLTQASLRWGSGCPELKEEGGKQGPRLQLPGLAPRLQQLLVIWILVPFHVEGRRVGWQAATRNVRSQQFACRAGCHLTKP